PLLQRIAIARRAEPTPGSTTATWIVVAGNASTADHNKKAPPNTSCGATACVTSTSVAAGAIAKIAPLTWPTYVSASPKSVSRLMIATAQLWPPLPLAEGWGEGAIRAQAFVLVR